MARKLYISYDEFGVKLGSVKFYIDDVEVCALKNHQSQAIEISNDKHRVKAKVFFLPVFRGEIDSGDEDWKMKFQQHNRKAAGKFVLNRIEPLSKN